MSPPRWCNSTTRARSPERSGKPSLIAMEAHVARRHVNPETSIWLLQAKDFLDEARRLKPGPARNELRQVAAELRQLARHEARSSSARRSDWPE